jgi:hypothetical protein
MSDQSGAISDLEELFLAREFGLPSGRHLRAVEEDLGEAPEPRELEEVFRSRDFGRPVALELIEGGNEPAPNVVEFPFAGPGAKPLDRAVRQRAVAALSGVAAAALVIAGLASAGGHAGRADVSALAHQSIQSTAPLGGTAVGPDSGSPVSALTTASGGTPESGATTGGFSGTAASGGGGAAPTAVFASQPVAASSGASGPGPGGTPPATPAPGGGGTSLAPVTSIVGTAVSTAGSSVGAASGMVATSVPTAPTVAGTMTQTSNNVSLLGLSLVPSPAG